MHVFIYQKAHYLLDSLDLEVIDRGLIIWINVAASLLNEFVKALDLE